MEESGEAEPFGGSILIHNNISPFITTKDPQNLTGEVSKIQSIYRDKFVPKINTLNPFSNVDVVSR